MPLPVVEESKKEAEMNSVEKISFKSNLNPDMHIPKLNLKIDPSKEANTTTKKKVVKKKPTQPVNLEKK